MNFKRHFNPDIVSSNVETADEQTIVTRNTKTAQATRQKLSRSNYF